MVESLRPVAVGHELAAGSHEYQAPSHEAKDLSYKPGGEPQTGDRKP